MFSFGYYVKYFNTPTNNHSEDSRFKMLNGRNFALFKHENYLFSQLSCFLFRELPYNFNKPVAIKRIKDEIFGHRLLRFLQIFCLNKLFASCMIRNRINSIYINYFSLKRKKNVSREQLIHFGGYFFYIGKYFKVDTCQDRFILNVFNTKLKKINA